MASRITLAIVFNFRSCFISPFLSFLVLPVNPYFWSVSAADSAHSLSVSVSGGAAAAAPPTKGIPFDLHLLAEQPPSGPDAEQRKEQCVQDQGRPRHQGPEGVGLALKAVLRELEESEALENGLAKGLEENWSNGRKTTA